MSQNDQPLWWCFRCRQIAEADVEHGREPECDATPEFGTWAEYNKRVTEMIANRQHFA